MGYIQNMPRRNAREKPRLRKETSLDLDLASKGLSVPCAWHVRCGSHHAKDVGEGANKRAAEGLCRREAVHCRSWGWRKVQAAFGGTWLLPDLS